MHGVNQLRREGKRRELLVLGVDTCGPSGTVALARVEQAGWRDAGPDGAGGTDVFGNAGGGCCGIADRTRVKLADVGAIVVVNGPGSFTGVRVGLSAVKGLAEPGQIPVMAVSRLAVLAAKAGVGSAALDAHRHEVFLRDSRERRELWRCEELVLAGAPRNCAGMR